MAAYLVTICLYWLAIFFVAGLNFQLFEFKKDVEFLGAPSIMRIDRTLQSGVGIGVLAKNIFGGLKMIVDLNQICDADAITVLKNNHVTAVGRYYTKHSWVLKSAEAIAICRAGMKLFTVFENTGHRDLVLTEEQGKADGHAALKMARDDVKQPFNSVIYFAAEGNHEGHADDGYNEQDVPDLKKYFAGILIGIEGKYKVGVYGDGVVCGALLGTLCTHAWIAEASYEHPGTQQFYEGRRWAIAQVKNEQVLPGGLTVDFNEANGDFGAFTVPIPD
ncbi:glycoside hydrolase domain-containing protein [Bradyrhizobium sp.]